MHPDRDVETNNAQLDKLITLESSKLKMQKLLALSANYAEKCSAEKFHALETENLALGRKLEQLQELHLNVANEKLSLEEKRKERAGQDKHDQDVEKYLESFYCLKEFRVTNNVAVETQGARQITLHYLDTLCHIIFEAHHRYKLLQIYPEHPNFVAIQQFLDDTQDLTGLLANCRKFFDFALSTM